MATVAVRVPDDLDEAEYLPSDEIAEVAAGLIRRHNRFDELLPVKTAYLERLGEPSGEGEGVLAKCQKASPLWRDVAGVELVIWVWADVWRDLEQRQREALVAHELCHAHVTDTGKLKLVPHDLEEFAWIARQYGAWDDAIRSFDWALRQNEVDATRAPGGPEPIRLPGGRERRRPGTRKPQGDDAPPVITP